MAKSRDAFRTISEVADWLEVPAHVLRFWESKFSQIKPVKRAGGRRYYRPNDMELISGIQKLLHDDGITIKGVQKILREEGVKHVASLGKSVNADVVEEAAKAKPKADPQPEPVAEAEVIALPTASDDAPITQEAVEPETAAEDAQPAQAEPIADTAELADDTSVDPAPTIEPDPAPEAEPPAPQIAAIEVPADPSEDDITVSPSVLAQFSAQKAAANAAQLKPIYDRLVALRARMQ